MTEETKLSAGKQALVAVLFAIFVGLLISGVGYWIEIFSTEKPKEDTVTVTYEADPGDVDEKGEMCWGLINVHCTFQKLIPVKDFLGLLAKQYQYIPAQTTPAVTEPAKLIKIK